MQKIVETRSSLIKYTSTNHTEPLPTYTQVKGLRMIVLVYLIVLLFSLYAHAR